MQIEQYTELYDRITLYAVFYDFFRNFILILAHVHSFITFSTYTVSQIDE